MSDEIKTDFNILETLPDNRGYCVKGVDWKEVLELRSKGLSHNQIAKSCGCSRQNISYLLRQHGKGLENVETYKKNRSDLLAAKQSELLDSMTPEKIANLSAKDAAICLGILADKELMQRTITGNVSSFAYIVGLACSDNIIEIESEPDD